MDPEVEKILKTRNFWAEFSEGGKFIVLRHNNGFGRRGGVAALLNKVEALKEHGYRLSGSVQADYLFTYATLVKDDE